MIPLHGHAYWGYCQVTDQLLLPIATALFDATYNLVIVVFQKSR